MRKTMMMKWWMVGMVLGATALVVAPVAAQGPARVSQRALAERDMVSAEAARRGRMGSAGALEVTAPAPWLQEDPAAKAYAAARDALNTRKYREAAEAFAAMRGKYPKSGYVADSYYYQAFALSRVGDRAALEQAMGLLAAQREHFPKAGTQGDANELRVRIEAQLARRGDATAAAAIARQASDPCDQEEGGVRAAALSALMNMNAEAAIPLLKEVLKNRDACSAELRRQAVFLLSQKMTDESVSMLLDLAHRNPDPDPEVREQAVFWLSQVKTEEAMNALESIVTESKDPELQERAIFAIAQQGSERAVRLMKDYAERDDAPTELRQQAIFWIGQNQKAGGTQYLIDLYPKLKDPEVKERTVFAIAQSKSPESRAWLMQRARDTSERVEFRKNALFWAGQTGGIQTTDLKALYSSMSDQEMKEQVIFVASQRHDAASVDFLMDVARSETDSEMQQRAIFWLGQSKDPRVAEFLLSLIRR